MHIKFKREQKRKQKNGKLETQSVWFCHFSVCLCVFIYLFSVESYFFTTISLYSFSPYFFFISIQQTLLVWIFLFSFLFDMQRLLKHLWMRFSFCLSNFLLERVTCYFFPFRTIVYILSHSKTVNSVVIFKSPTILCLIWIRFQFKLINI